MPMTVLVTGGAGFIGSNLVRHLLAERPDWRIVTLDKLTYAGHRSTLEGVLDHKRHRFVVDDIADAEAVDRLFTEECFDAVLNLAAESHVDRSIAGAAVFIETNVQGVQVLLDAARRHEVDRFVQVSTDEVYGALGPEGLFTEDSPLAPSNPYSASKTAGDLLALAWHRTYGLDVRITRCSNNHGPHQFPEKLIPVVVSRALEDQPIPVYGDGSNVRDWIHVNDHCRAILAALEQGQAGRVYNIGADGERSNIELVRLILKHLGKPETLITFVGDRAGHDWRYAIDSTRACTELGWSARPDTDNALRETVDWYTGHQDWWRPMLAR
jgi:dTDP-glucose 4,6-dehydratase